MTAQATRLGRLLRLHRGGEPAAFDDVDIAGRQLTAPEQFEAPARSAGHSHRRLQVRWKALDRRVVEAVGRRIAQPYPPGFNAEQIRDALERLAGCTLL